MTKLQRLFRRAILTIWGKMTRKDVSNLATQLTLASQMFFLGWVKNHGRSLIESESAAAKDTKKTLKKNILEDYQKDLHTSMLRCRFFPNKEELISMAPVLLRHTAHDWFVPFFPKKNKWHPRKTGQLFAELKGMLERASNSFSHPAAVILTPKMLYHKKTIARALQNFLRDNHPELASILINDDGILKIGSN